MLFDGGFRNFEWGNKRVGVESRQGVKFLCKYCIFVNIFYLFQDASSQEGGAFPNRPFPQLNPPLLLLHLQ